MSENEEPVYCPVCGSAIGDAGKRMIEIWREVWALIGLQWNNHLNRLGASMKAQDGEKDMLKLQFNQNDRRLKELFNE